MITMECKYNSLFILRSGHLGVLVNTPPDWNGTNLLEIILFGLSRDNWGQSL